MSDGQHESNYRQALRSFKRKYYGDLLTWCHGNVTEVAQMAGVDRSNLHRRLRRLGLKAKDYRSRSARP
jgi:DNA-binding NtrC family response regulator